MVAKHRFSVLLGLLLLLWAAPAAAEMWFEAYHKAEQALAEERWAEAVSHLNDALQAKPDSEARARTYGMRFVAYFPYLRLAIAYHHLGQYEAALQALESEERQGAIRVSDEELAELEAARSLITGALARAQAEKQQRAQLVAEENLAAARDFEHEGRLDEAMAALSRVLAVVPGHPEAEAAKKRLLAAVTEQQRTQEIDLRFTHLREQGRAELDGGRFGSAAAAFSQALELRRDPEVQALLERAQLSLRAEIETRQSGEQQEDMVARSLARVAELEAAGDLLGVLSELQAVLAVDPGNAAAIEVQRRVLRARAAAEKQAGREENVARLLVEAEALLAEGDFARAMGRANQVLALEPTHDAALRCLAQASKGLGAMLLGPGNAPPVILFDEDLDDGRDPDRVVVVQHPELVLSGRVFDGSAVELIFACDGRELVDASVRSRQAQGLWVTEFRLVHRLDAGLTTVEVTAVDEAGATASASYSVSYEVPFVRTPWMPLLIATALGALIAGVLVHRVNRRRRLLRRRFNPYVAGAPILAKQRFYGRDKLLDYVLRRIANNSILLYGERRIGKTSFQHQLKRALATIDDPEHEFFPVFIDLQGTPEERFFATLGAEVFDELGPLLDGVQPLRELDEGYGHRDLVKDLHRVLQALATTTRKKVKLVLLIDEVDELNDYDPRVNQKLRSLFMRTFADSLVSVVSGVAIKKHWEREGSPWYNFFQEVEVEALQREAARDLVEEPIRGVFHFDNGVVEAILERTRCKPYLIQRLCSELLDRLHDEQRQRITMADLDSISQVETTG